ncbi:MAG: A/G-specific adenine glycosylase [Porphyrobacter sp.]|nr:A/G-specific adenine glycosylase [Porphyrobacter sp.]
MEDRVAPALLDWYDRQARALPWRLPPGAAGPPDPYRVWLAEVMLQQTTVAAVVPRYRRFLDRWPDIAALAAAPPEAVMAEWAGLGYYSRARNLVACARAVAERGGFPESEAALRALPGLGAYTAAAVAAIAFGRRAVVVDANVERVVARLFALDDPLPGARKPIRAAADAITPAARPGDFAQAMMDLGATVCLPRGPDCLLCPLATLCAARAEGRQEGLPVRAARRARPERRGAAWWIERDGQVLLVTRPAKGPLGAMRALPDDGWSVHGDGSGAPPCAGEWIPLGRVRHGFTHFVLDLAVLAHRGPLPRDLPEGEWVALKDLAAAGLPRLFALAADLATGPPHSPRRSDDPAAKDQPQRRDGQHDQAEIAPAIGPRQRARADPGDGDRQHEPVAPAQKRDRRRDGQQQRDNAERDGEQVQHGVLPS